MIAEIIQSMLRLAFILLSDVDSEKDTQIYKSTRVSRAEFMVSQPRYLAYLYTRRDE